MLDKFVKEILDARLPAKNLKYALLALGYAILASLTFFLALDSIGPGNGRALIWVLVGVYYLLTIVSGVYAFLACRNSVKSLKTNRDVRNYISLVLGGILLIGICREILLKVG